MDYFHAIVLAVVQGIAEFLPISSSGHLVIAGALMNQLAGTAIPKESATMGIALHFGTLMSILLVYRKELVGLLSDFRMMKLIVIATIPVGVIGLLLKDYVDEAFQRPIIAGFALLITAGFLLAGRKLQKTESDKSVEVELSIGSAIAIGLFQSIAIVPGISRSGSTIAAGMACGMKREDAARFSFLIAIPAIGGASVLELKDFVTGEAQFSGNLMPMILGMVISFAVGVFALRWLIKMVVADRLHRFAFYCLIVGVGTIIWQLSPAAGL